MRITRYLMTFLLSACAAAHAENTPTLWSGIEGRSANELTPATIFAAQSNRDNSAIEQIGSYDETRYDFRAMADYGVNRAFSSIGHSGGLQDLSGSADAIWTDRFDFGQLNGSATLAVDVNARVVTFSPDDSSGAGRDSRSAYTSGFSFYLIRSATAFSGSDADILAVIATGQGLEFGQGCVFGIGFACGQTRSDFEFDILAGTYLYDPDFACSQAVIDCLYTPVQVSNVVAVAGTSLDLTLTASLDYTAGESFWLTGILIADAGEGKTVDAWNSAHTRITDSSSFTTGSRTQYAAAVPEPGEWALFAAGLALLGWRVRRRA